MKIPLGDFGSATAIAEPAPLVNMPPGAFSQGLGLEKLGNTGIEAAVELHRVDTRLNRAQSANDFQDYRIAEQTLRLNLGVSLADGTLSSSDAPAAYTSGLADIPKPSVDGLDSITAQNVQRGTAQVQAEGLNYLIPMIKGAQVLEQKSALDNGMDKIGKLAGLPGADVAKEISAIDAHDAEGLMAYGKNWAKVKQNFVDQTWFDSAGANIERNSGSMTALQSIQSDLKDPNGSYADHLDTKNRTELLYKVEQQIHASVIDANNAQTIANRETAQQQDQIMQNYLIRSTAGRLTAGEVQKDPVLDFSQKYEMTRIIEAQANKMDRTDPKVFSDLFARIHPTPGATVEMITSPDQLYPYVGKGLSVTDMGRLRAEVDGKNQPEGGMLTKFQSMAKDAIEKSSLGIGKDPVGERNFYEWNAYFEQQLAAQQKAGIPLHDLLDPTNKNYLGPTINRFVRTPQQVITDIANGMNAATPNATTPSSAVVPRNPGESPDAYLTRIGSH